MTPKEQYYRYGESLGIKINDLQRLKMLADKCQEDMVEKKYTEEDMIKFAFDTYCYISGIMKVPFNKVSENITHAEENLKVFINSLNKQD
jgi:hypothetical protein